MNKNVFTYWQGPKTNLIVELEDRLKTVCQDSGYDLYALDDKSIHDYIDIPDYFSNAIHIIDKSDLIRIELLAKHGGIWVDKDVLALREFDHLFEIIERRGGFVVKIATGSRPGIGSINGYFNNAILGSLKGSTFYERWSKHNHKIVQTLISTWGKLPFGNKYLKKASFESWLQEIEVINGRKTKMEYFADFRARKLLADLEPEYVMNVNPSLVHFFERNCRIYNNMSQEQKEKTLLHRLVFHR